MVSFDINWLNLRDVVEMIVAEREANRTPKRWLRERLDEKLREMGYKSGDKIFLDNEREYVVCKTADGLLSFKKVTK